MEDTSLDEFFESDGEAEPEESESQSQEPETSQATAGTDGEITGESSESEAEPAVTTARWTVDGAVCAVCETTTNRLWDDDGESVCRDCKEW